MLPLKAEVERLDTPWFGKDDLVFVARLRYAPSRTVVLRTEDVEATARFSRELDLFRVKEPPAGAAGPAAWRPKAILRAASGGPSPLLPDVPLYVDWVPLPDTWTSVEDPELVERAVRYLAALATVPKPR
jgi:hypothetical protein